MCMGVVVMLMLMAMLTMMMMRNELSKAECSQAKVVGFYGERWHIT